MTVKPTFTLRFFIGHCSGSIVHQVQGNFFSIQKIKMNRTFIALFLPSRSNAKKLFDVIKCTLHCHAGGRLYHTGTITTQLRLNPIPLNRKMQQNQELYKPRNHRIPPSQPWFPLQPGCKTRPPANATPSTPAPTRNHRCERENPTRM